MFSRVIEKFTIHNTRTERHLPLKVCTFIHPRSHNNSISEQVIVNTAKEILKKILKIFLAFENNKKKATQVCIQQNIYDKNSCNNKVYL